MTIYVYYILVRVQLDCSSTVARCLGGRGSDDDDDDRISHETPECAAAMKNVFPRRYILSKTGKKNKQSQISFSFFFAPLVFTAIVDSKCTTNR